MHNLFSCFTCIPAPLYKLVYALALIMHVKVTTAHNAI